MYIHPRSLHHNIFDVWRSPNRFTKNPDLIQLPSGRLMIVYSDTDAHWSRENQILTLLASDDLGKTWFKHRELATAERARGDERLVTPRLSRLNDGRLVVLCDHDDDGHFHEDQPPGNWAWWSTDNGETWSDYQNTGIMGFEPDRMLDLPDGRLGVTSHIMRSDTREFAVILSCSEDSGKTWYEAATVAHNGYHRFCEGALVILDGGTELACVMRENHSAGIPSFVAFSRDSGNTWSDPQMLPFAIHRPYARQLFDGRVLVTGRHVNGPLGTYAWCGDLHAEAGTYQIGGPRCEYTAHLNDEALVIQNRPDHECRYTLLPAEDSRSEIHFEAELKIDGPPGQTVAFMSLNAIQARRGIPVLYLAADRLALIQDITDFGKPVDFTDYRTIRFDYKHGLLKILIDGEPLINTSVFREVPLIQDYEGGDITKRTQFGQLGDTGKSHWKRVSYTVKNPSLPDHTWAWTASEDYPDAYQRERLIQVHGNRPNPHPDHGYSSWLPLEDGRIIFVDYTNLGDEPGKSHLVGTYINPEDIA